MHFEANIAWFYLTLSFYKLVCRLVRCSLSYFLSWIICLVHLNLYDDTMAHYYSGFVYVFAER